MTTAVLEQTDNPLTIEPVSSRDYINIYEVGDALDDAAAAVIADAEGGHWKDSLTHGGTEAKKDLAVRHSSQQDFPSVNSPSLHVPFLRYSALCLKNYLDMFPAANNFTPFSINENYNIVRYLPGQAYHGEHSDFYSNYRTPMARRHLTGLCFLNDMVDGGELEFPQQEMRVKPTTGRFVIFPSGWMHTHRTLPSATDTRYVFQLWWSFS